MIRNPPNGWYPDPVGRHAQRFWDGSQWTEHVATGAAGAVDPLYAPTHSTQQNQTPTHTTVDEPSPALVKQRSGAQAAALAVMGMGSAVTSQMRQTTDERRINDPIPKVDRPSIRKDRVSSVGDSPAPKAAGWYADPNNEGGTRYSDGAKWTGDIRPLRKPFAAASHHEEWWGVFIFGVFFFVMSFFSPSMNDGSMSAGGMVGLFFFLFIGGATLITASIYLKRGQGPSTQEIENRLAEEKKEAKAKRRSANVASFFSGFGRRAAPVSNTIDAHAAATAQINAISDPDTARALQNLQNLLYTQVLTDDEFQAAKDKLLGPAMSVSQTEQIEQLAELHRQGVLGDLEFASAKARVLGI